MARLIGLDIGTSSCKAVVIDESGNVLTTVAESYPLLSPREGWNEQDPESWWAAAIRCLDAVEHFGADAIGLTGQMHGSVFLDSGGTPLRPAILWNDLRSSSQATFIEERVGAERYKAITCNRSDPGLQAPKLLWLSENEPEIWAQVRKVLLPKDYVAYRLTGVMATDFGDASGTGLFDTGNMRFSAEILDALDIDSSVLPSAVPSTTVIGSDSTGRPIVIGSGDQAANGVGVGAIAPGVMSIALGSSGVLFTACERYAFHESGNLNCFAHATGKWLAMGVTLNCGTLIEWARRELFNGIGATELSEAAAESVGSVHFAPYVGGERCPIALSSPRFGFSEPGSTFEDQAAAVIRSITFNLRTMLPMVSSLGGCPSAIRVSGGGAASSFWRQSISDAFEVPVERLATDEGPSFGAALLAGTSIGVWQDVEKAVASTVKTKVSELPANDVRQHYEEWLVHVEQVVGEPIPVH